jgi:hypothetical protein
MREAIPQMARIGDIGDALDAIKDRLSKLAVVSSEPLASKETTNVNEVDNSIPYGIGQSDRAEDSITIPLWVHSHGHDPVVKVRPYVLIASLE